MACAPLWVCRIRRKVAHLIKRTQRQQGLMAHQQQRRSCQRHPSDRRSSWLITMLKCDGSVWTESCEIRTEAIARRLFRMELRSIRNAANCLRPMQRDADHAFVVRHSVGGGTQPQQTLHRASVDFFQQPRFHIEHETAHRDLLVDPGVRPDLFHLLPRMLLGIVERKEPHRRGR